MDVSPRKKPPFSPRKTTRAATPEQDDDDVFGDVNRPTGVALLLRSVYTPGSAITTTSAVTIAQKAIDTLLEADSDLPSVIVTPFSTSKVSASCYLRIPFDPDDSTPRFDILEIWLQLLRESKPEWEVVWQPCADGKDKRMSVRFSDPGFRKERGDKSACPALEKVKTALAARGIITTDSYSLTTGSYITLADHHHVDDMISAGAVTVASISPNPIPVMRGRQIDVKNCFELVVSGMSEGEGVQSSLCKWIRRHYRDPVSDESCFVDACVPELEPDCLVFYMTDWSATSRVLASGDLMVEAFKEHVPSMHRPQLLLAFNNNGMWRPKTVTQTFRDGADSLNEGLKAIRGELVEFKRETRAQHESTQLSITNVAKSVTIVSTTVEHLHTRLSNQASAILAITAEASTRAQLAQVQLEMAQHQSAIKYGLEEFRTEAKAEYGRLYTEQTRLTKSLSASAGVPAAFLGGTIGSSMTAPKIPPGITLPERRPASPSAPGKKRPRTTDDKEDDSAMHDAPPVVRSSPSVSVSIRLIAARERSSVKSMKWSETNRVPARRVAITKASLKGRILAIDVILPTDAGRGFLHRIIGLYAPWDPGIGNVDLDAREFWADVTQLCKETRTSWSLGGDLNATVNSSER
ncbi:hypothetical protein C8R46DRAFT_881675, partial [Mycena filopes]